MRKRWDERIDRRLTAWTKRLQRKLARVEHKSLRLKATQPIVDYDSQHRVTREEHWDRGMPHRSGSLPAIIKCDPTTGVIIREEYWENGMLHRPDGQPAIILRDKDTAVITYEAYFEHDQRHRAGDLPAVIRRNRQTGEIIRETYWENGKRLDSSSKPMPPVRDRSPEVPRL